MTNPAKRYLVLDGVVEHVAGFRGCRWRGRMYHESRMYMLWKRLVRNDHRLHRMPLTMMVMIIMGVMIMFVVVVVVSVISGISFDVSARFGVGCIVVRKVEP